MNSFTEQTYRSYCDKLATLDSDLRQVITTHGYPPFWSRPNTFETLCKIILEQQVSLASAAAAYQRLISTVGELSPETILSLNDQEFKAAYVSRQKARYLRGLAHEIQQCLDLKAFALQTDEEIRARLLQLTGIGNWTVDIYLIMVLHRPDVFPLGDVAAMKSLREIKNFKPEDNILAVVESWHPYRTIAACLLWHRYLCMRNRHYA